VKVFTVYAAARERGLRGWVQRVLRLPTYPAAMGTFHSPAEAGARAAADAECQRLRALRRDGRAVFERVYVVGTQVRTPDRGFAPVEFELS
jgi:hypothetical protein